VIQLAAVLFLGFAGLVGWVWAGDWLGLRGSDPHAVYLLRQKGVAVYPGITRQDPADRYQQHKDPGRQHGRGRWKEVVEEMTVVRWCRSKEHAEAVEDRMILALRWSVIAGTVLLGLPRRWVGNVRGNRPLRGGERWLIPLWVAWYTTRALIARYILRRTVDPVSGLPVDGRFVTPWTPRRDRGEVMPEAPSQERDELFEALGIDTGPTTKAGSR
jgi:predicted GIY-YIG superfamily endonuclease